MLALVTGDILGARAFGEDLRALVLVDDRLARDAAALLVPGTYGG